MKAELNERLTRVGPGTPMGELMREYWMPIAASNEIVAVKSSGISPMVLLWPVFIVSIFLSFCWA